MGNNFNTNEHGLDCAYFHKKIAQVKLDLRFYRPDELARALVRLAMTADTQTAINTVDGMKQTVGSEMSKTV